LTQTSISRHNGDIADLNAMHERISVPWRRGARSRKRQGRPARQRHAGRSLCPAPAEAAALTVTRQRATRLSACQLQACAAERKAACAMSARQHAPMSAARCSRMPKACGRSMRPTRVANMKDTLLPQNIVAKLCRNSRKYETLLA
jgi:hypothetical protein